MSLVSIIIPCYNAEPYLAEAIESCLAQTHSPIEIIVIDDGSTDQSAKVAAYYPQVTVIHQENQGTSAAKNRGIAVSRGEFIQFLDADDVLLPQKIERCLMFIDTYPDTDIVYTDYELRSQDLKTALPIEKPDEKPEGQILPQLIKRTSTYWGIHCALIRREAFDRAGVFLETLYAAEDWNLWVRMAAARMTFRYVDEKLVWYRQVDSSASKNRIKMATGRLLAMEALRDVPLPPEIDLDQKIAGRHYVLGMAHWDDGNPPLARQHFQESIRLGKGSSKLSRLMWLMTYFLSANQAQSILKRLHL